MTTLRSDNLTLLGAPLGGENPLPFFRSPQHDLPVRALPGMPSEKLAGFGVEAGFRVLPYRMQDTYGRARQPLSFKTLVLENEYLAATFLPELGGRLYSLVHKPQGRELLACNPVFQPANLAIRNAWFSGGIEWNIGQLGHTFGTCAPLFAGAIRGEHGEPGLRLYEFERCKGLFWQIDCYLPPGSPLLLTYVRVVNPTDHPEAMYWWTNIAVPETPGTRVLAPTDTVVYLNNFQDLSFGAAQMPELPSLPNRDASYSLNFPFANEYFFQCDSVALPWEAALDASGKGLFEASTPRLAYRKLFCWGTHAGGRRWQEFLSEPGQAYLEIQAGLAPTQLHTQPMAPHSAWEWMQVFGLLEADPRAVHTPDWHAAYRATDQAVHKLITPERLASMAASAHARADTPAEELLHSGAGWGALELARRATVATAAQVPAAFVFPASTLGPEQAPWLTLLHEGHLPEPDPMAWPGAWMTQPEWALLTEHSLAQPAARHWYALLHAGVQLCEHGDISSACALWHESVARKPSAWAYRNLAAIAAQTADTGRAIEQYAAAWALAQVMEQPPAALAQEYLQLLCAAGQFESADAVAMSLPAAHRTRDRIRILCGRIALALGRLDEVEQALQHEYADIREGENDLTDLWFELWARRMADATGRPLDAALRAEAQQLHPPPQSIDYRLKTA